MKKQTLEICALQSLSYYNGCTTCQADDRTKICYTSLEDLQKHLTDFRNLFHPQVQRFYSRYGYNWRERIGV